jgi:hypothetical protein
MGGLVLDIYVIYVIKLVMLAFKMRGSDKWPIATATVFFTDESAANSSYPTATVAYSYEFDGKNFDGGTDKPFISPESAKQYLARFPKESRLKIRVKPNHPEISVVREGDQLGHA